MKLTNKIKKALITVVTLLFADAAIADPNNFKLEMPNKFECTRIAESDQQASFTTVAVSGFIERFQFAKKLWLDGEEVDTDNFASGAVRISVKNISNGKFYRWPPDSQFSSDEVVFYYEFDDQRTRLAYSWVTSAGDLTQLSTGQLKQIKMSFTLRETKSGQAEKVLEQTSFVCN